MGGKYLLTNAAEWYPVSHTGAVGGRLPSLGWLIGSITKLDPWVSSKNVRAAQTCSSSYESWKHKILKIRKKETQKEKKKGKQKKGENNYNKKRMKKEKKVKPKRKKNRKRKRQKKSEILGFDAIIKSKIIYLRWII